MTIIIMPQVHASNSVKITFLPVPSIDVTQHLTRRQLHAIISLLYLFFYSEH